MISPHACKIQSPRHLFIPDNSAMLLDGQAWYKEHYDTAGFSLS